MLFIRLSLVILNNLCFFYLFLNVFANINTKETLFNKMFKTLTKIATTYVSISFLIKKVKFSIKIKVRF